MQSTGCSYLVLHSGNECCLLGPDRSNAALVASVECSVQDFQPGWSSTRGALARAIRFGNFWMGYFWLLPDIKFPDIWIYGSGNQHVMKHSRYSRSIWKLQFQINLCFIIEQTCCKSPELSWTSPLKPEDVIQRKLNLQAAVCQVQAAAQVS